MKQTRNMKTSQYQFTSFAAYIFVVTAKKRLPASPI